MTRKEITDAFNSLSLDARKEYLEALKAESKTQYDNFIKDLSDQAVQDFWDNERELIKQGKGTRDWTIEQQQTIMNIGKNGDELTHAPEKRTYVNKLSRRNLSNMIDNPKTHLAYFSDVQNLNWN